MVPWWDALKSRAKVSGKAFWHCSMLAKCLSPWCTASCKLPADLPAALNQDWPHTWNTHTHQSHRPAGGAVCPGWPHLYWRSPCDLSEVCQILEKTTFRKVIVNINVIVNCWKKHMKEYHRNVQHQPSWLMRISERMATDLRSCRVLEKIWKAMLRQHFSTLSNFRCTNSTGLSCHCHCANCQKMHCNDTDLMICSRTPPNNSNSEGRVWFAFISKQWVEIVRRRWEWHLLAWKNKCS